jgi:hypothetical protein
MNPSAFSRYFLRKGFYQENSMYEMHVWAATLSEKDFL